jgi:hypothetical protein
LRARSFIFVSVAPSDSVAGFEVCVAASAVVMVGQDRTVFVHRKPQGLPLR